MSLLKFLILLFIAFFFYGVVQLFLSIFHWLKGTKLFSWIEKGWHFLPQLPRNILNKLNNSFIHHLITNLIIGLVFTGLFLVVLYPYPLLLDPEDEGMDLAMQILEKNIPAMSEKNIPPFVFLDIDDKTHQAWGEPLFTPRNRLKNLIDAAVKAEARLIVVDVGLSQNMPIEGLGFSEKWHPYDQALYDYLANYAANCEKKKDKSCPPIILPPTFRASLPKSLINISYFSTTPLSIPETRSSFLDAAVTQSMPYVQWASTAFFRSSDHVIRRWWLWQPTCTQQQPGVIPSVELLAAALIRNDTPQQTQTILNEKLSEFKPKKCPDYYVPQQLAQQILMGKLTVTTDTQGIHQRIMYSMPWRNEKKQQPPHLPYSLSDAKGLPILTVLSAQRFAESPPAVDLNILKNSIVVIGGSYSDGGDIHLTPLGNMPGSLILVNAIHSLLQYEEVESVPLLQKFYLQAGLIFLITVWSFLFVHWQWVHRIIQWAIRRLGYVALFIFSLLSGTLSGVIIIIVVLPLSLVLLRYGVWLDFVIPLMLVQLYQTTNDFNDLFEQYKPELISSQSIK